MPLLSLMRQLGAQYLDLRWCVDCNLHLATPKFPDMYRDSITKQQTGQRLYVNTWVDRQSELFPLTTC